MDVDENVFFREATLRICSSLDIGTALERCFEYIRAFIPANGMTLHILDPDLNLLKFVASVGLNQVNERVLPLPEKGRDKRAADLQAALLTNEGKVLILHPDKEPGLPEILEQLGINANISLMNLILQLERNQTGTLALYAHGLNQYTGEHARLLQLLHGPFAMAMSKALEHQEVIERNAELRRSEAYLAETQRLSHTGNWVWNPIHPEFLYASEEMLRLYGFDPQKGIPTTAQVLERIHPDDRDKIKMPRAGKADVDFDYKFVLPDGTLKHFHCVAHPVLGPGGETQEVVGIVMDITDRKRAEEERLAQVWFLERMDRINRAMQGTNDLGQIMSDVLDAMLSIFECDRAFLVYPCDPDTPSFEAVMERTRPGYPARRGAFPADSYNVKHFQLYLASSGAVTLGPGCDYPLEISRFDEKSKMMTALYPKTGKPWVLGMHQCSYPRVWSEGEKKLLGEIALRMGDVLTSLLVFRSLRESEKALRQTEAYLAEAQRLSHTGSWAFDLASNKYVYVSEECLRIFEMDSQEGLPTRESVSRLIHPEDWDSVQESFEKSLREKVDTSTEFRIAVPSGTAKRIQAIRHPVLNDAGDVVQFVGSVIDITERNKAEAEINSLKNYLSNIIDSMPSILVGMDNTRTVTQWNRQAEAFTGIPAGEAIGKPIVHLLPDFAPWIMTMGTDLDEHRPSSMEKLLIEKEGERRFYDLMLYPLFIQAVGGAVLRVEDVTERARIQELMVQTEKMMSIGGLAAGMAHEINNPLGIITQAAQNIERRISPELPVNREVSEELGLNLERIHAYFEKRQIPDALASIRTASSRAAKIVANMLQFSRRADTTMVFTSLAQIVDQALELAASDYDLKKKYDFRSIEIIKDYQDTPQVPIVALEIEQVILNLLKNAAQAMIANPPDRRPSITFRIRCEDRYAVLEVEDNGPGMPEDVRRRIFEPFFTTKEPGVGTGLGLSVSYMIVTQNHKGLMEVQSTPGRGTLFKVRLPIGESNHE